MKTNFPPAPVFRAQAVPEAEGSSLRPARPLEAHPLDVPERTDSPEPALSWGSDLSGTNVKPRAAEEVQSRQATNSRRVMESELTRRLSQVRLAEDRFRPYGLIPPEIARLSVEAQDVGDRELVARASVAGSKRRPEEEAPQAVPTLSSSSSGKRSRGSAPNRSLGVSPHHGEDLLGTSAPW